MINGIPKVAFSKNNLFTELVDDRFCHSSSLQPLDALINRQL
ncbi:hypothetical protein CU023_2577 [Enterococcus faecium]|nr:hypothetical protein [Enterococcus faecium]MBK4876228.1 hypothetical protein [Enterococcus faecium]